MTDQVKRSRAVVNTDTVPIHVVSAFTDHLFGGNPAAVVLLPQWLPAARMQAIAAENRLSETAFVCPQSPGRYAIRWFSPLREVPFCGHATLASAWVLLSQQPQIPQLVFSAAAVGEIVVQPLDGKRLQMRFTPSVLVPVSQPPQALLSGLSQPPVALWRNCQAYVAQYDSEEEVRRLHITRVALQHCAPLDVAVTAPAQPGSGKDFVSRYFWLDTADLEDPVTGSIHAALAPFWATRLGTSRLQAAQLSARGGCLTCTVSDEAVWVAGTCVSYLNGQLAPAVSSEATETKRIQ